MLIEDARTVARKAWSVRLALLAAVLSAAEVAVPFLAPDKPSRAFAAAAAVVALAAAVARVIAQPKMYGGGNG